MIKEWIDLKTGSKHKKNIYTHVSDGYTNGTLPYKVIVEYIDDKEKFNYICKGNDNRYEPWELYTKCTFDSLNDAMDFFMTMSISDYVFDIKMFIEQIDDREMFEEYITPSGLCLSEIKRRVNKDMKDKLNKSQREIITLREEIERLNEFIKIPMISNLYKEFLNNKNK